MMVGEVILFLLAAATFVPVTVVAVECAAAMLCRRRQNEHRENPVGRAGAALLVPAHNEEASIGATVAHLRGHLREGDRLLMVADNCSDATASAARRAGADVVERHDETKRGKGFALAAGIDALRKTAPQVVIVVDADCRLEEGAVDALVSQAMRTGRPAQAAYVMALPARPSPRDAVSGFAFVFKNVVRPSGLFALGQPCLLTGTGMAFPWSAIERARLATGDIVEDMRLGIELAMDGCPPMFCPEARVESVLPGESSAATSQRTRWEHGHLKSMLRFLPRLAWHAISRFRPGLAALALELGVPPLSLLVGWMAALLAGTVIFAALGYSWIPLLLSAIAWALLSGAIVLGWWGFARERISLGLLLTAPLYVLWKLPMYVRFFVKPQRAWVRTARDDTKTQASAGANEGART